MGWRGERDGTYVCLGEGRSVSRGAIKAGPSWHSVTTCWMNGWMDEQAGSGPGFLGYSTVDIWGQMDDSWLCVGEPSASQEV